MFADTLRPRLKTISRKFLPAVVRRSLRHWLWRNGDSQQTTPVSYGSEVVAGGVPPELLRGWQDSAVAERQQAAFAPLLRQMYQGKPREDFIALATAVRTTQIDDPLIIEVGCGSGWNSEVLTHLLRRPVRYIGLDYSPAMTALGKRCYPDAQFVVGNAMVLPFQDGACDILLSGTVLMHLLGYEAAIHESRRVAQKWCIFHTVPTVQKRPTTVLRKLAYGSPVVEVVLNSEEFLNLIADSRLTLRQVLESIPHDYLSHVLDDSILVRTYLCEVT